jgi:hypothetical protein
MAVKAPAAGHVLQNYVLVHLFEFSWLSVRRHALVTLRTRENAGGERRRRNKEFLGNVLFFCKNKQRGYEKYEKRQKSERVSRLFIVHVTSSLQRELRTIKHCDIHFL